MDIINTVLALGAIATAVAGICTLAVKIYKLCKRVVVFFYELRSNVNMLIEHDKAQYLSILRLTIINESMPVSERLLAGKTYLDLGGNGDVKDLYDKLEAQCERNTQE